MAGRALCLGIALLGFLAVTGLVKAASPVGACLGTSLGSCTPANLTCESPFVLVLLSAQQGFKASSSQCARPGPECPQDPLDACCRQEPGDCLKPLGPSSLLDVAKKCWGTPQCQPPNPSPDNSGCNFTTRDIASYVLYQYACVNESETLSFLSSERMERETAVMRYSDNQTQGSWACYVESSDCSPRPARVFLYVNRTQGQQTACSTLSINNVSMSCDLAAVFSDVTLPAKVGVTLDSSHNISSAWAAVRAENGSPLRVWCGSDPQPSQQCPGTTPSATSSASTDGATAAQSQGASLVAATAVGWVLAGLAITSTVVLLVLLLRRQGKFPGFRGIFRKEAAMMPPPDAATLEAPSQSMNSPAVRPPSCDYSGLQEEATKPSDNAYMDMDANAKSPATGGKSRQSSHPTPVVSEEEYSPLETQGQEGEMYSPLEVEGDENEYQGMQEEIYENA